MFKIYILIKSYKLFSSSNLRSLRCDSFVNFSNCSGNSLFVLAGVKHGAVM